MLKRMAGPWPSKRLLLLLAMVVILCLVSGRQLQKLLENQQRQEILHRLVEEGEYLVYGANQSSPPLRFADEDGAYKGVVVDLMNQISLELGVEIRTVPYLWEEALEALRTGETDICDMFVSEERAQHYVFTKPIYNLRTVLAIRAEDDYGVSDINGMRIATESGDYANSYMQEHYPGANLVYVANLEAALALLFSGDVDGVVGDEPVIFYYMNQRGEENPFKLVNTTLYEEDTVLAVTKAKAELVPLLNEAIDTITRNGQLEKIQQKWFGISTPLLKTNGTEQVVRTAGILIGTILLILILFVVNNRSLKQQVNNRTRELLESRNELRVIFDGITEYIAVVDHRKKVVNANQGLAAYLQRDKDSLFGAPCQDCFRSFCKNCDACLLEECLSQKGSVKREVVLNRDVYELIAYPIEGIESGVLVSVKNITMEALQRTQLLQSSKMMAVGQLAAGMAHEMRNPLGIIRAQSYLLRESAGHGAEVTESLNFIDASVQRAGAIIDNIMNFWRNGAAEKQTIPFRENAAAILALFQETVKSKAVHLALHCPEELELWCGPEALKHILLNLVANALDAVTTGGQVEVSAEADERGGVTIRCRDDGCGIPEAELENLFNPFFTTKAPGSGTGLGLFIVYSEVEKLDGKVEVESQCGEGTEFRIFLPAPVGDQGKLRREEAEDERV